MKKDGLEVITYELVETFHSTWAANKFAEWMEGQTCVRGDDHVVLVYADDYERWVQSFLNPPQQFLTWD